MRRNRVAEVAARRRPTSAELKEKKMRIEPTVGRVVLFRPGSNDSLRKNLVHREPLAAIIAAVHSSSVVNLAVFDVHGQPFGRVNVWLTQEGSAPVPEGESHCHWMPYQLKVASGEIQPVLHAAAEQSPEGRQPDLP